MKAPNRLPRVCASEGQAKQIMENATHSYTMHVDALDVVYTSRTFANAFVREAWKWGVELIVLQGAPAQLRTDMEAAAKAHPGIAVTGMVTA